MSELYSLIKKISDGRFDSIFSKLYGKNAVLAQRKRYTDALTSFSILYPDITDVCIFSAPGRVELCGNHTDHNRGKTLSAAIDLDVIAVAAKDNNIIEVNSQGFGVDRVELSDIELRGNEAGTSKALIKGVCDGLRKHSKSFGGFRAYTTSNVLKGSGVSSSAAFEVLMCEIQNHFYNNGEIDSQTVAKISQYAENEYFKKPSGLLDQMSCATGAVVYSDFKESLNPQVKKVNFDFEKTGYTLVIVNTGANHSDLTDDYAAIVDEMKKVARFFSREYLREVNSEDVMQNISKLREKTSDRAILRALHFLNENERVEKAVDALEKGNFECFLKQIRRSGRSSFMYLQNIYTPSNPKAQAVSLALCLCEQILEFEGAFRVHGGGFGGTIEAFVPNDRLEEFCSAMDGAFSQNCCNILRIRPCGGVLITE